MVALVPLTQTVPQYVHALAVTRALFVKFQLLQIPVRQILVKMAAHVQQMVVLIHVLVHQISQALIVQQQTLVVLLLAKT